MAAQNMMPLPLAWLFAYKFSPRFPAGGEASFSVSASCRADLGVLRSLGLARGVVDADHQIDAAARIRTLL